MKVFWIAIAVLGAGLILLLASGGSGGNVAGMPSNKFASILYLGVLASVIGAGIFGSGRRLGETARTLAIWAVIVLALMTGYEYRYELQDVGNRLSGGIIPGSPLTAYDADGRATVSLSKRMDGHFAARVTIDGATVEAMVDTGATATVLTSEDARRAGFDPENLRFVIPVATANGTANAARVVAQEVSVGSISRRNVPLLVAEPGRLGESLLGMNFIGTLSGFDLRGDRLILRD